MAHVTRIKAGDKNSEDESKKATSKNVKDAIKIAKNIVKEEKLEKPEKKTVKKEKVAKTTTKKENVFKRVVLAPGRYIKNSWIEIRQVRWPNRKATWKLVGAIFIYSAFFIVLVMLLDALFNFIFSKIIG